MAILAAAVQKPAYTADFNEVTFKGVAGSSNTRTPDESVVAMFWDEASHRSRNRAGLAQGEMVGDYGAAHALAPR